MDAIRSATIQDLKKVVPESAARALKSGLQ
jgi:hypothetical protein